MENHTKTNITTPAQGLEHGISTNIPKREEKKNLNTKTKELFDDAFSEVDNSKRRRRRNLARLSHEPCAEGLNGPTMETEQQVL